ncbi:Chitinase, GH18 family [Mucilaginibacter pineti]|uniref:chitinase n=1 Tax=Mucilaginibacter pineti TaxID=1391627 RepID=A0A1G7LRJ4_9SPHI|nr:glycosyl hydrolase family 18 protein [Mucilaginibacter pineti]SDF52168.1 Chitinase, GH18 family [Mucilaginibacter pineti]
MKKIIYTLVPALVLVMFMVLSGCKKDEVAQQEAANPYSPRIFDKLRIFAGSRIINEGETAKFTGLAFSPASKVQISWLVDGKQMSTDTAYQFKPDAGGEYTIKLNVVYNGDTTSRQTKVLVNPTNYTFKPYAQVVLANLTEDGTAADINWKNPNMTHLDYQLGKVSADGSLDITKGNIAQHADELVARAHIAGIPIILGISGHLSGIDGWAIYESNDFGSAIRDPAAMASLVQSVKAYVAKERMDGVDINMTDINSGNAPLNIHAIGPFLTALKAALPATAIVTVTATVNYQHWEYPDLSAATWVNIHAYEDNGHIGPDAPVGQSSSFDFMVSGTQIWTNFHLPASKLVVGIPAFGLRYNALNDAGNNASWGSYDYMTYKDIIAADPTAAGKEKADIAKGVYFNGIPLVTQKAAYIKNNGFKGAYLWAADYDATGANSLLATLYNALK